MFRKRIGLPPSRMLRAFVDLPDGFVASCFKPQSNTALQASDPLLERGVRGKEGHQTARLAANLEALESLGVMRIGGSGLRIMELLQRAQGADHAVDLFTALGARQI